MEIEGLVAAITARGVAEERQRRPAAPAWSAEHVAEVTEAEHSPAWGPKHAATARVVSASASMQSTCLLLHGAQYKYLPTATMLLHISFGLGMGSSPEGLFGRDGSYPPSLSASDVHLSISSSL